jgi:hypothetical protein
MPPVLPVAMDKRSVFWAHAEERLKTNNKKNIPEIHSRLIPKPPSRNDERSGLMPKFQIQMKW